MVLGGSKPNKCRFYGGFRHLIGITASVVRFSEILEKCRKLLLDSIDVHHYVPGKRAEKLGYTF